MDWKTLSYILRSEQRREIILALESPKTPTQIAKATKLAVSHVSRTLRDFTKKEIVECKTPKEKIGRIYILTPKGRDILKSLRK